MSSPSTSSLKLPQTPPLQRRASSLFNSKPTRPSPLASSPERISPSIQLQSRRRQQFKSTHTTHDLASTPRVRRQLFVAVAHPQSLGSDDTPQTAFLRRRLKQKCFEHAQRSRERRVKIKRWGSEPSSDGFDMDTDMDVDGGVEDDDDDDDGGFGLDDEIFRRIMSNERRRIEHAYRLSYELDVGSSIDPNMEDVAALEQELLAASSGSGSSTSQASATSSTIQNETPPDELLEEWDVDDDELAAMYEEYLKEVENEEQKQFHLQSQKQQANFQLTPCNNPHGAFEGDIEGDFDITLDDLMEG